MKSLRVLASLLALTVCRLADAGIITIDPSNFAAGTDLSHATPGVTLSTWSWGGSSDPSGPAYTPVYATDCVSSCSSFDGRRMFGNGHYDGSPFFTDVVVARNLIVVDDPSLYGSFSVFRADFDSPTNFVQLVMGGLGSGDPPMVSAFDQEGNVVAECSLFNYNDPCGIQITGESVVAARASLITFYTGMDNIAYILAGGSAAGSRIASMTFVQKSVPEPAQFGLLICGLIGMWAAMRGNARTIPNKRDDLASSPRWLSENACFTVV